MQTLSVVIPAYNEEQRLGVTLEKIVAEAGGKSVGGLQLKEVIVVDDGSADNTVEIAKSWADRLPIRVITLPKNRGKGAAVRTGMLAAEGDAVLMYDADGATPIGEVTKLVNALKQGSDVAIGSRVLDEGQALSTMKFHRRIIGKTYRFLCGRLIPGIKDAACGCKLFTRSAAQTLFQKQQIDRFAFDVEILALALRSGYKIAELPVQWMAVAESKVRLVRDGIEMFLCLVRLHFRSEQTSNQ